MESLAARVNAERVALLGWSRAILLQIAHPLVAAGVAEHSSFRAGALAPAIRLRQTVRAMLSLTFGDGAARASALARINGIHRRVHGTLGDTSGRFPAGTPYSAEDPALLLWVHATLLESVPLVYDLIVAPLSEDDRDAYCREAAGIAHALGVRQGVPDTWRALRDYLDRMYASGSIAVGRDARALARGVLAPPLSGLVAPARRINRLFTVGTLPPPLREQYGFAWTPRDARALDRTIRVLRAARRVAPDVLALWPEARRQPGSSFAPYGRDGRIEDGAPAKHR